MTKHTPGPWAANDSADVAPVSDPACIIAWVSSPDSFDAGDEPAMANARLIAAAPDMLAELNAIVNWHSVEKVPLRQREIDHINALIAKAEGRNDDRTESPTAQGSPETKSRNDGTHVHRLDEREGDQ